LALIGDGRHVRARPAPSILMPRRKRPPARPLALLRTDRVRMTGRAGRPISSSVRGTQRGAATSKVGGFKYPASRRPCHEFSARWLTIWARHGLLKPAVKFRMSPVPMERRRQSLDLTVQKAEVARRLPSRKSFFIVFVAYIMCLGSRGACACHEVLAIPSGNRRFLALVDGRAPALLAQG